MRIFAVKLSRMGLVFASRGQLDYRKAAVEAAEGRSGGTERVGVLIPPHGDE